MKDLFVPAPTRNGTHGGLNSFNSTVKPSRDTGRAPPESKPTPAFATLLDALSVYRPSLGEPLNVYRYFHADGSEAGAVGRWQTPNGKEIRPFRKDPDGWRCKAVDEPRPLYNLEIVVKSSLSDTVYVVEGEKCADALTTLRLVAVTSAGGALVAAKSDWSPLKGKRVVICPDNDDAGRQYADDVRRLATGAGAASVSLIDLSKHWPGFPKGGDVADLLAADAPPWGDAAEVADIREWLLSKAEPWAAESVPGEPAAGDAEASPTAEDFRAFPTDVFPRSVADFIRHAARSLYVDETLVAVPALVTCAAMIGLTRELIVKTDYKAFAIIWAAVVARSGSLKSAAIRAAIGPALTLERRWSDEFKAAKRAMKGDESEPPVRKRLLIDDVTVESVGPLLEDNPRGLYVCKDELDSWFQMFVRYTGNSKANDRSRWLPLHDAARLTVDRRAVSPIVVERAGVWLCGGVQPQILRGALSPEILASGCAARILIVMPPDRPGRLTDDEIPPEVSAGYHRTAGRLAALEFCPATGDPVPVYLSRDAYAMMKDYVNELAEDSFNEDDHINAALAKIRGYVPRFALVLHCLSEASEFSDTVTPETMKAAIALAKWFVHETRRVYGLLAEPPGEKDKMRLLAVIRERWPDGAEVRDVQRFNNRRYGKVAAARQALEEMVADGLLRTVVGEKGRVRYRPIA